MTNNLTIDAPLRTAIWAGIAVGVAGLLWWLSKVDFLIFHTLVEFLTIGASAIVLYVGIQSWRLNGLSLLVSLGVLYGSVGIIDLVHTLTYKGAGFFPGFSADPPTQLWILGRYLEAAGLAIIFLVPQRTPAIAMSATSFPLVGLTGCLAIFLGLFPTAYDADTGLTEFKIWSEFIIIGLVGLAAVGLMRQSTSFNGIQKNLLLLSFGATALAEFCFTQYASVYGEANALGHLLRLLSYYLIYRAVVSADTLKSVRLWPAFSLPSLTIATLVFVGVVVSGYAINRYEYAVHAKQERKDAEEHAQKIATGLSEAMKARLALTEALAAFSQTFPKFSKAEFDRFANKLQAEHPEVISLQLAPKGIVRFVTNEAQNKAAIGHDLLGDPNRRKFAELAIQSGKTMIVGPVDLIQGGRAIIARRPIYDGDDESSPSMERFWGFSTVLINVEALLGTILPEQTSHPMRVALRGANATGETGPVFHGSSATFDEHLALKVVDLPQGSWAVAVASHHDHIPHNAVLSPWFAATVGLAALIIAFGTYQILNARREARLQVAETRQELQGEIDDGKAIAHALKFDAEHDTLTGLPNRRLFEAMGEQALARTKRLQSIFAVLFIDLDGFKPVNDDLGHEAGDQVLRQVASRLDKVTRTADILARFGGDEFVIGLTDSDGGSKQVAENIIQSLSAPFHLSGQSIQIGASIGIAQYPAHGETLAELIRKADAAMYSAKKSGKNRYALSTEASDKLNKKSHVRGAI